MDNRSIISMLYQIGNSMMPLKKLVRFFCKIFLYTPMLFLVYCGNPRSNKPHTHPPNILFILADDQRYDLIHALGNKEIITPNLDELISRGTTFYNTYIMGAMNGAVCAPSRAMIITGRSLFDINPYAGDELDMPDTLLAEALLLNDYTTFHTGKWHNGEKAFLKGFVQGSKIFFGGMSDHYQVPTKDLYANHQLSKVKIDSTHSSVLFASAAEKFIREYDKSNPFFLQVSFTAPHDPRNMPQKYLDLYDNVEINIPPNFMANHPFDNGELDIRDEWLAGYPRTRAEIKANILAYYAMISHMDEQIGKIIQSLDENGLRENTIIVFTSDNGLAVGQHGLMGKQNLYEHSIKVPLIIQGPGIPEGMKDNRLVYTTDLFPTICDLTGTKKSKSLDGISLVGTFKNRKSTERTSLIFAYKNSQRAIRKGKFKLIEYLVKGQKTGQLFNLKSDPWEIENLYEVQEFDSKKIELQNELQKQLTKYNDQVVLSSEYWNVKPISSWIKKVSPSTIDKLRKLAQRDRELRGFFETAK
tara:strand:+ start:2614 stop:4200 length:1587 start_codon:yes stop_codon:yes gene_type:complete